MTAEALKYLEPRFFIPAKPQEWAIWLLQQYVRFDLLLNNRLQIGPDDLAILRALPKDKGIMLTPNHADECDFKICVELSRLSGKRFYYLMNAEAFSEGFGLAGWFLQRLGAFSVERGGDSSIAKQFAVDVLKNQNTVLIVFPEGEIYYLNDNVQHFKSGVVEIGMQSILEMRKKHPDWDALLVPMSIKYRFAAPLNEVMERKFCRIEKKLDRRVRKHKLKMRVLLILAELLHREEITHKLAPGSQSLSKLSERVAAVRKAMLEQLEEKYPDSIVQARASVMDRIWQLSSYVRSVLRQNWPFTSELRKQLLKDLSTLKRLADMAGWQTKYLEASPSQERLAESIMKLERDVCEIRRPKPLAKRNVYVKFGKPMRLSDSLKQYLETPHEVRRSIAEGLRQTIQALLDSESTEDCKRPTLSDGTNGSSSCLSTG